ncbi:MAG: hypothetical protein M3P18_23040 [Actinomycetota bacterium]|nr:hypothetical protein [Actinomycetota bacterium]
MFPRKLIRFIAAGAAAIVVAIGAFAIVSSSSSNGVAGSANAATLAQSSQPPRIGHAAQPSPNQRIVGQIPKNWHSGSGTIITGAAANKAKAAARAKYPGGTINRVLKLSDGSYAVHMIKISWPHHVFVSKSFKVTGAIG